MRSPKITFFYDLIAVWLGAPHLPFDSGASRNEYFAYARSKRSVNVLFRIGCA